VRNAEIVGGLERGLAELGVCGMGGDEFVAEGAVRGLRD